MSYGAALLCVLATIELCSLDTIGNLEKPVSFMVRLTHYERNLLIK